MELTLRPGIVRIRISAGPSILRFEHTFDYRTFVRREDLDDIWRVENLRRSLAMLNPEAPGLSRNDALLVLELLMEQMAEQPSP